MLVIPLSCPGYMMSVQKIHADQAKTYHFWNSLVNKALFSIKSLTLEFLVATCNCKVSLISLNFCSLNFNIFVFCQIEPLFCLLYSYEKFFYTSVHVGD